MRINILFFAFFVLLAFVGCEQEDVLNPTKGTEQLSDNNSSLLSTINNGTYIFRSQLCPSNGISLPPSGLRILALRDNSVGWGGSAPMLHYLSLDPVILINLMLSMGLSGTTFLITVLPDVFIAPEFSSKFDTYSTLFHELSHASHYSKVGNPYWFNFVNGIVNNYLAGNDTYGDGTGNLDGFIGVGEMWGYYSGYKCTKDIFGWGYFDPYYSWFKPGILDRLVSSYGFTPAQIFACQTSDVNSHEKLKNKIISNYGYATQVTGVFEDYGF
ncbi:MAG: hypothetical protein JW798_10900 [Prolixibacteraceae bacterium]|nr:hypothetical protein [Prolixibacteraceae bacterium]